MNCRVDTVHKCLTAAADICRRGNRVVIDDDGSFIINKAAGETIPLHKKNGTYVMRVKVLRPGAALERPGRSLHLARPRLPQRLRLSGPKARRSNPSR